MIVVKAGTTSYRRIANISEKEADEVVFDGVLVFNNDELGMIWDDVISNIRAYSSSEVTSNKRLVVEKDIDELVATKIAGLFGKPPHSLELMVKQQNAQARVSELQEKNSVGQKRLIVLQDIEISGGALTQPEIDEKTALLTGILTAEEEAEKNATQAAFTLIKATRMNGKTLKTNLATASPDTFDINTGWSV